MRFIIHVCFVIALLALSGCGERELVSGLDERDSIDAILALRRSGIPASREMDPSGRGKSYRLIVASSSYGSGLEVIGAYGFPRKSTTGLSEAISGSMLLPPSKDLNRLRVNTALSFEAERMLQALPGVVDVRVSITDSLSSCVPHIQTSVNVTDVKNTVGCKISALVFIRSISNSGQSVEAATVSEQAVRDVIKQVVRGIEDDNIKVDETPISLSSGGLPFGISESGRAIPLVKLNLFSFRIPEEDMQYARVALSSIVVCFGLCTFFVGLVIGFKYLKRTR